jgi:hypothetical protein
MEDKFQQLHDTGVFAEAAAVHAAYLDMAAPPESSLEGLKRAVFLGWYESSEPGCFTGVGELNPAAHQRSDRLLYDAYREGRVDAEFAVMLGWYWFIADYRFKAAPSELITYLSGLDPEAYRQFGFTRAALESRGQMGVYWVSMACRAA